MNRMACLWLPQRCVDILICIRQEVQDAGGAVGDELKEPVDKLVVCVFFLVFFASIYAPIQCH